MPHSSYSKLDEKPGCDRISGAMGAVAQSCFYYVTKEMDRRLDYRKYTDAIKDNLISSELTLIQVSYTYANEADILNVVLFGKTAK